MPIHYAITRHDDADLPDVFHWVSLDGDHWLPGSRAPQPGDVGAIRRMFNGDGNFKPLTFGTRWLHHLKAEFKDPVAAAEFHPGYEFVDDGPRLRTDEEARRMRGESPRVFLPGDVIERRFTTGVHRRVVQDPVRTSRGKLRFKSEDATTVATAWWASPDQLPRGFVHVPRSEA